MPAACLARLQQPSCSFTPRLLHDSLWLDAGISLSLPAPMEDTSTAYVPGAARRLATATSGSSLLAQRIAGTHFLGEVEAEDDYGKHSDEQLHTLLEVQGLPTRGGALG